MVGSYDELADLIRLNGTAFRVARDEDGRRMWQAERKAAGAEDRFPARRYTSFGFSGMGSSVRAVPNQMDYSTELDHDTWGELAPGLAHVPADLALAAPITKMVMASASEPPTTVKTSPTGSDAGGALPWTNPTNLASSNDTRASRALTAGQVSNGLNAKAWGGGLTERPQGIKVEVEGHWTGGLAGFNPVISAQLLDASGNPIGTAKQFSLPATTDTYVGLGGPLDDWDTNLSLAEFNDADYGVRLTATAPTDASEETESAVASTTANDASQGGQAWGTPSGAGADDANLASVTLLTGVSQAQTLLNAGTVTQLATVDVDWNDLAAMGVWGGATAYAYLTSTTPRTEWATLTNLAGIVANAGAGVGVQVSFYLAPTGLSVPTGGFLIEAQLVKGGVPVGEIKSATAKTFGLYSFGSGGDLWGMAFDGSDLTGTFGVRVRATAVSPFSSVTYPVFIELYSFAITQNSATSQWLMLSNRALSIPGGATISTVHVEAFGSFPQDTTLTAQLVVGGVRAGSAKQMSGTTLAQGVGGSDAWDNALTQANTTAAGFGVALRAVSVAGEDVTANINYTVITVGYAQAYSWAVNIDHVRMTLYGAPTGSFLYVASGNVLSKLTIDASGVEPVAALIDTKTFTHGPGGTAAPITDIIFVKGGRSSGNGFGLVGFGSVAPVQQIDVVDADGADTYSGVAATAYAGKFATSQGPNNYERLVWRSLGGISENVGNFCRVASTPISAGNKDYSDAVQWTATPYQVGDFDSDITHLDEYQRGLLAIKPEGTYPFDQKFQSYNAFSMKAYAHPDNGVGSTAWEKTFVITGPDLQRLDEEPDIGLGSLVSNLSPVKGRVLSTASYGPYLFFSVYNGEDSYIVRARRPRRFERVPQYYVFHVWHLVAGTEVRALLIRPDAQGTTILFHAAGSAGAYDVHMMVLDPPTKRRHATSGEMYGSRDGSSERLFQLERVVGYGLDLDGQNYYQPYVAFDGGPWRLLTDATPFNATGRMTRSVTPAAEYRGYEHQMKLVLASSSPDNRPRLRGLTVEDQGDGGLILEGTAQTDSVIFFNLVLDLADFPQSGLGGELPRSTLSAKALLDAFVRSYVTLAYYDEFGDWTERIALIDGVTEGGGDNVFPKVGERQLRVQGRIKVS